MHIKVISETDSNLYKFFDPTLNAVYIDQANCIALVNQNHYFRPRVGRYIKALVPVCISTASSQVPESLFLELSKCYEVCVKEALASHPEWVVIRPLGCGVKITKMSSNGCIVPDGVWGNLFWTQSQSLSAAKMALTKVDQKTYNDVTTVFVVPQENLTDWMDGLTGEI